MPNAILPTFLSRSSFADALLRYHTPLNKDNIRCSSCSPGMCSNTTYCSLCPEGTYSNQSNSSRCTNCPDGFVTQNRNMTKCNPCRAGETSVSSHEFCRACEPGTYNPKYCSSFPLNTLTFLLPFRSGGICLLCPKGQCQSSFGGKNCYPCAFPFDYNKYATGKETKSQKRQG